MRQTGLLLLFTIAIGAIFSCASSRGYIKVHVDTWTNNEELRTVHFRKEGQSAPVRLKTFDWVTTHTETVDGTCEAAVAESMKTLLQKSQELGGNSVYLVQSEGTRHWLDVGVCKRRFRRDHKYTVRMRGLAAHDPSIAD